MQLHKHKPENDDAIRVGNFEEQGPSSKNKGKELNLFKLE